MILETISNSIAALATLGPAEQIAAASALLVNGSALLGIRWVLRAQRRSERTQEEPQLRDAA